MRYLASLLTLLPLSAFADITATLSINTAQNDQFSVQINGDPAHLPGSVTFELVGGKVFDHVSTDRHSPPIGVGNAGNNDGASSASLTFDISAFPFNASGDIDGTGLTEVRIGWADSPLVQAQMTGTSLQTYSVILVEETEPADGEPGYTETAYIKWVLPTLRENGEDLPLGEIAGFDIHVSESTTMNQALVELPFVEPIFVEGPVTTATVDLPVGEFAIAARTVDTLGEKSILSNIVTKTVSDTGPGEPISFEFSEPTGALFVSAEDTGAYVYSATRDRILLTWVGTVPVGTECDTSQRINGRYVVPMSAFQPAGDATPEVIVATCVPAAP